MNEQHVEVECKGCGQALKTFLEQMAEHNGKVTCPHCGHTAEYGRADMREPSAAKSRGRGKRP
jgi:uncharacterized Zn finger protein (UPF0148 family)